MDEELSSVHPDDPEEFPFEADAGDEVEQRVERSLRPGSLKEFIGQSAVVENLGIAVRAALARGDVLDHVLLSGMPGLGKTSLALVIAREMGVEAHLASGPSLDRGKDVVGLLTNIRRGDVLFIDEIHRMSPQAEEYLYSAMEDFAVDILVDRGPDARSYRVALEPFTLIGATTREGLLSAPLRSRFGILEKLEPYPDGELDDIVRRSARLLGCQIAPEASSLLASRCRGTPRVANRLLSWVRDVAQDHGEPQRIEVAAVQEGLDRRGIDHHGLGRVDRKILRVLLENRDHPVGVKTLAVTVGEDERTLEEVYEPYLIRKGLVLKTPRGRRATARAADLYGRKGDRQPFSAYP